jgi:hypothetical protein
MTRLKLACFASLCAAGTALAAPADIAGTWECRQPGVKYGNKPPILYFTDAPGGAPSEVTVEVDGFAREVYGRAEVAQDADGWWKVKPAKGQEFSVRPEGAGKQRAAAMALRWPEAKSEYRCLRLPSSASRPVTAPSPGAENPQGTLAVPPSGAAPQEAAPQNAAPQEPGNKEPETKQ